jgi:hypothetical protein
VVGDEELLSCLPLLPMEQGGLASSSSHGLEGQGYSGCQASPTLTCRANPTLRLESPLSPTSAPSLQTSRDPPALYSASQLNSDSQSQVPPVLSPQSQNSSQSPVSPQSPPPHELTFVSTPPLTIPNPNKSHRPNKPHRKRKNFHSHSTHPPPILSLEASSDDEH